MIDITKIKYSGQYNSHLRVITNTPIITVEISPTGSGKTHTYKDAPNTIMLMPTNALVRQHGGMIAGSKAKNGERTDWGERITDRCDYMTYQKFLGHAKHENLSSVNIIIDEAHLVLSSDNPLHYDLLKMLFERETDYLELKLISATLRPDVLSIYNYNDNIQAVQYVNDDYKPKIQFTRKIPTVDTSKRTLFFINSKDKMIQVKDFYLKKHPDIKVTMLNTDEEIPDTAGLEEYDLILSTCVLKQGYSIKCTIDQVIIHNVHNSVGAMDIIQYMARPRKNTPDVYIIPSSKHFTYDYKTMPNLFKLAQKADQKSHTEEEYKANVALSINELIAKVHDGRVDWNIPAFCNYFEGKMITYELYSCNEAMTDSIINIVPGAHVTTEDVADGDHIKFTILDLRKTLDELKSCRDIEVLHKEIDVLRESLTDERTINKLNTLLKIKPEKEFLKDNQWYAYYPSIEVLQTLDGSAHSACKQHIANCKMGVYELRDKHDKRYLPMVGKTYEIGTLPRKLNFIADKFGKANKFSKLEPIQLLEKMYRFERYDIDGNIITGRSKKKVDSVKIIGEYPISETWFEKKNRFFKFNLHTVRN